MPHHDQQLIDGVRPGSRVAKATEAQPVRVAAGIRVPAAVGDFLILRAVRASNGFAIAVEDDVIIAAQNEMAQTEGLLLCPEGAATYAAWKQSLKEGRIKKGDRALLFNCATGLKYPMSKAGIELDRNSKIDFATL